MATNYPTALDTDTQFPKTGIVAGVTTGEVTHTMNVYGAVQALEAKQGIGASLASAAAAGWSLVKNADGTTTWQPPRVQPVVSSSAARTFALTDAGNAPEYTGTADATWTVPPVASVAWTVGDVIEVVNLGSGVSFGALTIAAGAGVTLWFSSTRQLRTQFSVGRLRYHGADAWLLSGDFA